MCGIAGVYDLNNKVELRFVVSMTNSISHRGPDGDGFWINDSQNVCLGHRRLAVIDLSDEANQPMVSNDGRYVICFNGEVYNYIELRQKLIEQGVVFKTNSDTEVLLQMYVKYGEKALCMLDGMFAITIWDNLLNRLFVARDRFGEKPLFFNYTKGRFIFASEIKALFTGGVSKDPDEKQLFYYIAYSKVNDPNDQSSTFYKNVFQVPPSCYMFVDKDGVSNFYSYWDLDSIPINNDITLPDAINRVRFLLKESVKKRLRSDVPVGSSLSGGLDSSVIVLLMSLLNSGKVQQSTFSARFKDFSKDEGGYIEQIVSLGKLKSHHVWVGQNDAVETFLKVCEHQDEPTVTSSVIAQWKVMELAAKSNVTVLLDGQGSDEVFGGYIPYYLTYLKQLRAQNNTEFGLMLKLYLNRYDNLFSYDNYLIKNRKNLRQILVSKLKQLLCQKEHNYDLRNLTKKFGAAIMEVENPFIEVKTLNSHLKYSLFKEGIGNLLRYADRSSMAHSREVRLPYLSHELVEFLFSLPEAYKLSDGWTKSLLRSSMKSILPESICWRVDKVNYETPQDFWLKDPYFENLIEISKKKLISNQIIRPGVKLSDWQFLMLGQFIK